MELRTLQFLEIVTYTAQAANRHKPGNVFFLVRANCPDDPVIPIGAADVGAAEKKARTFEFAAISLALKINHRDAVTRGSHGRNALQEKHMEISAGQDLSPMSRLAPRA